MPRTINIEGNKRSVATEAELLDFANAIRQAGGADVIEALLPSRVSNPKSCLIANALNFGCQVDVADDPDGFADGSWKWVMWLPHNLTKEQRQALGRVEGVRLRRDPNSPEYYLTLPKHIGNAAHAFDERVAFEAYAK